jgi:hypothetical protein
LRRVGHGLGAAVSFVTNQVEQSDPFLMLASREVEAGRGVQGLPQFLQQQQLRETGIEPSGHAAVASPIEGAESRAGPLPGTKAVESLASPIAQILTLRMDAATEIRLEELTGLPTQLVMTELIRALEGKRRTAEAEAAFTVCGEGNVGHFWMPSDRSSTKHKSPGLMPGLLSIWSEEIVCFWQTLQ